MNLLESLEYQPNELSFGTSGLRGLVSDMTDLECFINVSGFLAFCEANDSSFKKVCIAGDLRRSTPHIMQIVAHAVLEAGYEYENCGFIPTPALAAYAGKQGQPCIMVTGSHIPDDRNGIKFYKTTGEVLKSDEAAIKAGVAQVRQELYGTTAKESLFGGDGMCRQELASLRVINEAALEQYTQRFIAQFGGLLSGKTIVLYQHSAVGRDFMKDLFARLGANVVVEGRSSSFVPIDTENVTPADQKYFVELAQKHPHCFAIISTDGDGDRPFMVDENGVFHRGDELGLFVSRYLQTDAVALPISSNDATDVFLQKENIDYRKTKIGSPYVIEAMQELAQTHKQVGGWEVNGGYLLGSDIAHNNHTIKALATRDAVLPLLACMAQAIEQNSSISQLFAALPKRYTQAGLLDNFDAALSQAIVAELSGDKQKATDYIKQVFKDSEGFGAVTKIDTTDGVRIFFANKEVIHIRPSGNAPQLRIYTNADTQERANELVAKAIAEPNGYLRQLANLA